MIIIEYIIKEDDNNLVVWNYHLTLLAWVFALYSHFNKRESF